jgi:O-antigen/teichoic acid export membrane protein
MIFIMGKGLDIFLLGKLYPDLAQVTYYAIAYNFGYFSISALDRVFAGGFMVPLITELYARGEREKLHKVFSGSFQFIYIYALPVAVGGVILAGDLIGLLFGRAYTDPVGKLAALTLLYMAITKYGRLSASFMTAMDQEKQLILSRSIFGIINLGLNLALIPRYGAEGAVIGTGIAGILSVIYEARVLEKTLKPSYPYGFLIKISGSSLIMGLVVVLTRKGLGGGWMGGTLGALAAGAVFYLILLIILKPLTGEVTEYLGNIQLPGKRLILSLLG